MLGCYIEQHQKCIVMEKSWTNISLKIKNLWRKKNININENKLTTTATMTKKSHPCGMWNRQCHTCHTQISE